MSRFARLRAWAMRLVPAFLSNPERRSQRAMATLEAALAEEEGPTRLERLREALALAERVPDGRADTVVLEASLHLGERMRAARRPTRRRSISSARSSAASVCPSPRDGIAARVC